MAEAWQNNDGQPMNRGCYNQNGGASFASRNFNNSNYNKAPRREGGMNGGGGGGGGGYQGKFIGQLIFYLYQHPSSTTDKQKRLTTKLNKSIS